MTKKTKHEATKPGSCAIRTESGLRSFPRAARAVRFSWRPRLTAQSSEGSLPSSREKTLGRRAPSTSLPRTRAFGPCSPGTEKPEWSACPTMTDVLACSCSVDAHHLHSLNGTLLTGTNDTDLTLALWFSNTQVFTLGRVLCPCSALDASPDNSASGLVTTQSC
jgi:hypothetical protein